MPTRFRLRDDSYYGTLNYREGYDGWLLHPGPLCRMIPFDGLYESMTDVTSAKGPEVNRGVKPVHHLKLRYVGIPYSDWLGDYNSPIRMEGIGTPFRPEIMLGMLPTVSDNLLSNLNEEAFDTFSTQFPETWNVAEFTQGLTQLESLIPQFSGKLANDLASLKLGNDFGWQSLLNDLTTFTTLMGDIEARLTWLRKTHGKPTKLAFLRRNIISPGVVNDVIDVLGRGWNVRYQLHSYQTTYRAGATLTQRLEHLNDLIGYVRALSGASGFSNPVKSFWNLIPFSFLLDYFLPISRRLDSFKIQAKEPWDLSMMSHSVSTEVVWKLFQDNLGTIGGTYQQELLGFVTGSIYERRVGLPIRWDSYLSPTADLSSGQLTLLGALLAANS